MQNLDNKKLVKQIKVQNKIIKKTAKELLKVTKMVDPELAGTFSVVFDMLMSRYKIKDNLKGILANNTLIEETLKELNENVAVSVYNHNKINLHEFKETLSIISEALNLRQICTGAVSSEIVRNSAVKAYLQRLESCEKQLIELENMYLVKYDELQSDPNSHVRQAEVQVFEVKIKQMEVKIKLMKKIVNDAILVAGNESVNEIKQMNKELNVHNTDELSDRLAIENQTLEDILEYDVYSTNPGDYTAEERRDAILAKRKQAPSDKNQSKSKSAQEELEKIKQVV